MQIAVACGGTGGHIFPGLSTAQELVRRGHAVTLWLAGRDVEADSVQGWSGPVVLLAARGLRGGWRSRFGALASMGGTVRDAVKHMRGDRPDVVLAMGSYASVGPGLAARWLGIPLVLHEGNAVPGRAVQALAPFAVKIGTGFADTGGRLPRSKTVYCGFPVRDDLAKQDRKPCDPPLLLVTGGSQGAAILNRVVPEAVRALASLGARFRVMHLAGRRAFGEVQERYRGLEHMVVVEAFSCRMPALYATASLAITRAGAATCTELALARLPAVLIPFAAAPGNHQWHNAQAVARGGGFRVLAEADCTPEVVTALLHEYLENPSTLQHMQAALPGGMLPDGARRLADLVEGASIKGALK